MCAVEAHTSVYLSHTIIILTRNTDLIILCESFVHFATNLVAKFTKNSHKSIKKKKEKDLDVKIHVLKVKESIYGYGNNFEVFETHVGCQ